MRKLQAMTTLWKLMCRWGDIIKMGLKEIGGEDVKWTDVAKDRQVT